MIWSKVLLWLCLFGIAENVGAQSVKIDEKGKGGYLRDDGSVLLPCKYDAVYPFENGLGKVMMGKRFGLVDKNGKFIVPIEWDEIALDRQTHLYRVKKNSGYGLINSQGKEILQPVYSYISPFNHFGKALLAVDGELKTSAEKRPYMANAKYGVVNSDGTVAVVPTYRGLYEFALPQTGYPYKEGTILRHTLHYFGDTLFTDCKYLGYNGNPATTAYAGIMDERGNILMPMNTAQWICEPHSGMVRCYIEKANISYYNLTTRQTVALTTWSSTIKNAQEWSHGDFTGNIAPIGMNGRWCFVDKNGRVVKSGYKTIKAGTMSQLWAARVDDNAPWEVFDCDGKSVFENAGYTDYFFARNHKGSDAQYIGVQRDGRWGLIDKSGRTVLPFEFDKVNDSRFGWVAVKRNGKWGYISLHNEVIVPTVFDDTTLPQSKDDVAIYVKKEDGLWYVFNLKLQQTMGCGYKSVGYFVDGVSWAKPAGLMVDNDGLNRALVGENANDVLFEQTQDEFVLAVDTEGRELIPTPIPVRYMPQLRQVLREHNFQPLSRTDVKSLKLRLTGKQRHYDIKTRIDESNWDY